MIHNFFSFYKRHQFLVDFRFFQVQRRNKTKIGSVFVKQYLYLDTRTNREYFGAEYRGFATSL